MATDDGVHHHESCDGNCEHLVTKIIEMSAEDVGALVIVRADKRVAVQDGSLSYLELADVLTGLVRDLRLKHRLQQLRPQRQSAN